MNPAEDYIINQPEPYRSILMHLQALTEHTIPEVELKYKYRVPYYYIKGRPLCYFNASHKNQFVDVGFNRGNQIEVHKEHHVTENRKKMFSLRYKELKTIDETVFTEVLKAAVALY